MKDGGGYNDDFVLLKLIVEPAADLRSEEILIHESVCGIIHRDEPESDGSVNAIAVPTEKHDRDVVVKMKASDISVPNELPIGIEQLYELWVNKQKNKKPSIKKNSGTPGSILIGLSSISNLSVPRFLIPHKTVRQTDLWDTLILQKKRKCALKYLFSARIFSSHFCCAAYAVQSKNAWSNFKVFNMRARLNGKSNLYSDSEKTLSIKYFSTFKPFLKRKSQFRMFLMSMKFWDFWPKKKMKFK